MTCRSIRVSIPEKIEKFLNRKIESGKLCVKNIIEINSMRSSGIENKKKRVARCFEYSQFEIISFVYITWLHIFTLNFDCMYVFPLNLILFWHIFFFLFHSSIEFPTGKQNNIPFFFCLLFACVSSWYKCERSKWMIWKMFYSWKNKM